MDEALQEKIDDLSEQGNTAQRIEKFEEAIELFKNALTLIPSPKTEWEASTWLYVAIADNLMNVQKYAEAKENYLNALNCPGALENGYVYLGLGESLYELNQIEKAKENLLKAYMLEGKELFEDEDEKYLELIKQWVSEK